MRISQAAPWLAALLFLSACPKEQPTSTPTGDPTSGPGSQPDSGPSEQPDPPTPPAKKQVVLSITSPKEGETLAATGPTNVTVSFDLKNYEIKPTGQHIHVILDNKPYEAYYDLAQPLTLKDVPVGTHTIRAFPSAGPDTAGMIQHESIKDPGAFAAVSFVVGKPDPKEDPKNTIKATDPLLTFSRPKGEYKGDAAKKILFDFWVKNADIAADKYKVVYKLNAQEPVTLAKWEKIFFEGLAPGEHTVELWLVDSGGKEVPGAFNHTTRKITVGSLYERLGGQAAIEAVVTDFLANVKADKAVNKRFAKSDLEALKKKVVDQVCEATGGPCKYTGKSMAESHAGMKITEKEFNAFVADLVKALDKNKVGQKEKDELLGALGGMKGDIVGK